MNSTLGKKARDRVTLFEGTVTGHAKHLTGCDTVCLTPTIGDDGRLRDHQWFDIERLDFDDWNTAPCGFVPDVECKK